MTRGEASRPTAVLKRPPVRSKCRSPIYDEVCDKKRDRIALSPRTSGPMDKPRSHDADKLARIVERYLPDLANETRCYMIRFPHEVKNLLRKARRIRRTIKTRKNWQTAASHAGTTRRTKPTTAVMRQRGGGTKDEREAPRPPTAEGDATATPTKDNEDEGGLDEVDWGSAEFEDATPGKDTGSARSESPDGAGQSSGNMGAHRPRTPSRNRSPPRESTPVVLRPNLGAQRLQTPSRSPIRRPARRQPSIWEVQRVQEHMGASRQRRGQM